MTGVKPAMTLADSMGTDWPRVALLMLCGVFVATQVGKLPPAMPGLREHFGASLVQLGWLHERPEIDPGEWLEPRIAQIRLQSRALLAEAW